MQWAACELVFVFLIILFAVVLWLMTDAAPTNTSVYARGGNDSTAQISDTLAAAAADKGGNSGGFLAGIAARHTADFTLREEPALKHFVDRAIGDRADEFRFTPEGVFSVSSVKDARFVSRLIKKAVTSARNGATRGSERGSERGSARDSANLTIVDATACIGGNTIQFGRDFARVIAVEINARNYTALKHNVQLYTTRGRGGRPAITADIETIHGDFIDLLCKNAVQRADAVFIDPPWGGPEYRARERVRLGLSGWDMTEITARLPQHVFLKLPANYDVEHVRGALSPRVIQQHTVGKYIILHCLPYAAAYDNTLRDPCSM